MHLKTDLEVVPAKIHVSGLRRVFDLIWKDAARLHDVSGLNGPLSRFRAIGLALRPELFAMILYRWAHYFAGRNWQGCANFLYRLNLTVTGADIVPDSNIGGGCLIVHTVGVVIDADIGNNCTIFAHVIAERSFNANKWSDRPRLGDNVALSSSASILGNIYVADGVVVGPYSLVLESIVLTDCTVSDFPGKTRIISRNN